MIRWCSGWKPLDDPKLRSYFERELTWELVENPGHILASRNFSIIGGLGGYDDFLAKLDVGDLYAWVHLSWSRENQPEWPHCHVIGDAEALNQFLAEWANTNS